MSDYTRIAGYLLEVQLDSYNRIDIRAMLPQLNETPLMALGGTAAIYELHALCRTAARGS